MTKDTVRAERFSSEYVANGGNGTKAIQAIDPAMKEAVAAQTASRMLRNVEVQQLIEKKLRSLCTKTDTDAERVLIELHHIAMSAVGELFDETGCVRPIKDMPLTLRRAISSVDVEELWSGKGENREQVGVIKKIRFWNKVGSLELLGKHLELFVEKVKLVDNNPHNAAELDELIAMLTRLRDSQRAQEKSGRQ